MVPLSDSTLLISGSQTCVFDYVRNQKLSESPTLSGAAYSSFSRKLYCCCGGGFNGGGEVCETALDLAPRRILRFQSETGPTKYMCFGITA